MNFEVNVHACLAYCTTENQPNTTSLYVLFFVAITSSLCNSSDSCISCSFLLATFQVALISSISETQSMKSTAIWAVKSEAFVNIITYNLCINDMMLHPVEKTIGLIMLSVRSCGWKTHLSISKYTISMSVISAKKIGPYNVALVISNQTLTFGVFVSHSRNSDGFLLLQMTIKRVEIRFNR